MACVPPRGRPTGVVSPMEKPAWRRPARMGTCGGIRKELSMRSHNAFDLLKELQAPTFAVTGRGEGVQKDEIDGCIGQVRDGVAGIAPMHLNGIVGQGGGRSMLIELLQCGVPVEVDSWIRRQRLSGMTNDASIHFECGDV